MLARSFTLTIVPVLSPLRQRCTYPIICVDCLSNISNTKSVVGVVVQPRPVGQASSVRPVHWTKREIGMKLYPLKWECSDIRYQKTTEKYVQVLNTCHSASWYAQACNYKTYRNSFKLLTIRHILQKLLQACNYKTYLTETASSL